jgi:hypothetical protein
MGPTASEEHTEVRLKETLKEDVGGAPTENRW